MASKSFESASKGMHYPVRKDILDKIHPREQKKLAEFIRDLLKETSTFPLVWDAKTHHRKIWIEPSWKLIKEALQNGKWRGFNKCNTLIENAEAIFLDQRHQFYCDHIESRGFVEGAIEEFEFLQKNAPATSEEMFNLVLEERFIYPKCSSLMKPTPESPEENKFDEADWSDIEDEKTYWRKLEKENEAKLVKPSPQLEEQPSSSKKPYGPMSTMQLLKDYLPQNSQKFNPNFTFTKLSEFQSCNFPLPDAPHKDRDFHSEVSIGLRNHMAAKIARFAYRPWADENCSRNSETVLGLINNARKLETRIFGRAKNKDQYFDLLADKIYKLQLNVWESYIKEQTVEFDCIPADVRFTRVTKTLTESLKLDADFERTPGFQKLLDWARIEENRMFEVAAGDEDEYWRLIIDELAPVFDEKVFQLKDEHQFDSMPADVRFNKIIKTLTEPLKLDPDFERTPGFQKLLDWARIEENRMFKVSAGDKDEYSRLIIVEMARVFDKKVFELEKELGLEELGFYKHSNEAAQYLSNFPESSELLYPVVNFRKLSDIQVCNMPEPEAPQAARDWHENEPKLCRNTDIVELLTSCYPKNDPDMKLNKGFQRLFVWARCTERETYENAENSDEYLRLIGKISLLFSNAKPTVQNILNQWSEEDDQNTQNYTEKVDFDEPSEEPEISDKDANDDNEADWSDIEVEDYWTIMARENEAQEVINDPNHDSEELAADWYDIEADDYWTKLARKNAAAEICRKTQLNEECDVNEICQTELRKAHEQRAQLQEAQKNNEDDADWSDIEAEDYWTKMAKENAAKEVETAKKIRFAEDFQMDEETNYQLTSAVAENEHWARMKLVHELATQVVREFEEKRNYKDTQENTKLDLENQEDADWSDIEADDYWTKMARDNEAKEAEEVTKEAEKTAEDQNIPKEKINYDDLEEGFFENEIVPAVVAAGKKIIGFGQVIADTIKKILEDDEPEQSENNTNEPATPRHIEMNVLDSTGKKISESQEATTSTVRAIPSDFPGSAVHRSPPNMFTNTSVEEIIGLFGRVYYVNHFSKTVSLDNPLTWRKMPENWETRITENQEVYYFNKITKITQWDRPTGESE